MNHTTATRKPADRALRAYAEASKYLILDGENEGEFYVQKLRGTDAIHYVTTADTCTCPDHGKRGLVCKHSHLVRFHIEAMAPAPAPVKPARVDFRNTEAWQRAERDRVALFG